LRHETRSYEVFLPGTALTGSEWNDHIAAVIRVQRDILKRSAATGLWKDSHETAYYVCDMVPSAKDAANAIRQHWGIENRAHYVRDGTFAEDASRIRKSPGVFARIRSFAANILRFNHTQNVANTRYRIAIGGIAALRSIRLM
jgi:predicted transposase YbfD/YdcC